MNLTLPNPISIHPLLSIWQPIPTHHALDSESSAIAQKISQYSIQVGPPKPSTYIELGCILG